jgi:pyridoxal phosphate enzyme, YggS family
MNISQNISRIREKIDEAAEVSGRKGSDIILVAATKTQDADSVRQAIAGGVDACGENRVQELTEKQLERAYDGAPVHFIGHLQKNKLRKVVGIVDLIESVDSPELLKALSKRACDLNLVQDILIEVNIGDDPSKYGLPAGELENFLNLCEECGGVRVRGLMTILPVLLNSAQNRRFFAEMHKIFVDIRAKTYNNVSMDYLSMGMSGDYYDAILEGANMVRIGSAIFGSRN